MENAAQALLIAGGILLAILTLSLIVYMSNNVSTIGSAQAEKQEVERLAAWNAEWEAYNKQVLYGAEVLTVRNKADQNNLEYTNVEYHVTIICTDKNGDNIELDMISKHKKSIFECINIVYSDKTGRVESMTFNLREDLSEGI